MDLSLAEKVAVVTGGSRGIDKAIARALAREGTNIALIARNISVCETTAMELTKKSGQQVRAYRADTGEDTAVHEAFAQIVKDFLQLDILVNAAAQPGGQAPPPKSRCT